MNWKFASLVTCNFKNFWRDISDCKKEGIYDNWERLVDAVLKREQLKQLAYCESLSSSISSDFNSRVSFASAREDASGGRVASGAACLFPTRLFTAPAIALARFRRRKRRAEEDSKVHLRLHRRFSLHELQVATDNFSNKNIIGRSVFSNVYKGRLADGSLVAVKRLKEDRTNRGEQEFQIELDMSSKAVHQNLLHLRGFCMTPTEKMLVYPFMVNGSVASCLRGSRESRHALDWPIRKRVALETARGLAYLHDYCDPKIVHLDVKAAIIYLDFEALVGGFMKGRFMDYQETHVTTTFRGTIGHMAPEYLSTGKCSEKTDVFGYGIMLLELITGQRAFDRARLAIDDDVMLLDRLLFLFSSQVKRLVQEKRLETLVDPDLQGNYIDGEVEHLIQLALLCTQSTPMERPKMSEVVRMLESDVLVERWEHGRRK